MVFISPVVFQVVSSGVCGTPRKDSSSSGSEVEFGEFVSLLWEGIQNSQNLFPNPGPLNVGDTPNQDIFIPGELVWK